MRHAGLGAITPLLRTRVDISVTFRFEPGSRPLRHEPLFATPGPGTSEVRRVMERSIFTKLIGGEAPCYKVFEDEHTFGFLSLLANRPGHTLLVPKIQVDYFVDLPEPYYSAVFRNAKPLARAIHEATGCKRVGTVIAGWDVAHFHYHLIPMFEYHDLDPRRGVALSAAENQAMQQKILSALSRP